MKSPSHLGHIRSRVAHNDCPECRADCERQFLRGRWPGYLYLADYLRYAKPRLEAIRSGDHSPDANRWHREFVQALNQRITLKVHPQTGRKESSGYLERIWQFRSRATGEWQNHDSAYLRRFAQRGASAL